MPKSDGSLSAVIVSGGKQYRVAPGDQILVDRLAAEPGSSLKLGRVLLLRDGLDPHRAEQGDHGHRVVAGLRPQLGAQGFEDQADPGVPTPAKVEGEGLEFVEQLSA